jgi:hypothetical protein
MLSLKQRYLLLRLLMEQNSPELSTKLYISGGAESREHEIIRQFISLDLTIPWSINLLLTQAFALA